MRPVDPAILLSTRLDQTPTNAPNPTPRAHKKTHTPLRRILMRRSAMRNPASAPCLSVGPDRTLIGRGAAYTHTRRAPGSRRRTTPLLTSAYPLPSNRVDKGRGCGRRRECDVASAKKKKATPESSAPGINNQHRQPRPCSTYGPGRGAADQADSGRHPRATGAALRRAQSGAGAAA